MTSPSLKRFTINPLKDKAAPAVLKAFEEANSSNLQMAECYIAGVHAWNKYHPDHSYQYSATAAVEIILQARRAILMIDFDSNNRSIDMAVVQASRDLSDRIPDPPVKHQSRGNYDGDLDLNQSGNGNYSIIVPDNIDDELLAIIED